MEAGDYHTCALLDDGTVACWGYNNSSFQLGQSTPNTVYSSPHLVGLPNGVAATTISSSDTHTCALLITGSITCWGSNHFGQFGAGATSSATHIPTSPFTLAGGRRAISVAVGNHNTCAISDQGDVNCWGRNNVGQLGDGTTNDFWVPTVIPVPSGSKVRQIAVGLQHVCALLENGELLCWGDNGVGKLGVGDETDRASANAVAVQTGSTVVAVATSYLSTCASLVDGTVTCWGFNHKGQLGDGSTGTRSSPVTPRAFEVGTRAAAVAAGGGHTCLLNTVGQVWCWGLNSYGQLGRGVFSDRELDLGEPVALPAPGRATAIATGIYHTCALLVDGHVSCWGLNSSGQLGVGQGSPGDRSTPSAPIALQGSGRAKAITAGGSHSCALHTDGSIACWGYNAYGQLGDGGTTNQFQTHDIIGLPGGVRAVSVDAGLDHTCALQANGDMTCWGRNGDGQLGDGTTIDKVSPVPVSATSGTHATAIEAGGVHTCALYGAGTVTCWGDNNWGQLGLDPNTFRTLTAPSGTLSLPGGHPTKAVELAVGDSHTCVLLGDGGAACWGYNGVGALGDGTTTTRFTPANVSAQPGVLLIRSLSSGFSHTCGLLGDGKLSCWGQNWNGQLGTRDRVDHTSPTYAAMPPGPAALAGVTASASVTLTWNESTSPYQPQTWEVEGSTDGTTWWPATVSAVSPSGTTVSGLTNGVPFLFRVRSVTPVGVSNTELSAYVTPAAAIPRTCEGSPDAVFPEGDGSIGNPYIVTTSAQLEAMRLLACLSQHFLQHQDIEIPEGTAWDRIGTVDAPFTGSFDGGGQTISNVSISAVTPGVGFFGALSGATIRDLTLGNVVIVAAAGSSSWDGRVGSLAGDVVGSTISGVTITNADVSATGQRVGGLIGRIRVDSAADTVVTNSQTHASVTGASGVGGLIGAISSGSTGDVTVSASFASGDVAGNQDVGGVIGYVLREAAGTVTVESSYSTSDVSAQNFAAGGLIGGINPASAGGVFVLQAYAVGSVTAPADSGGLIGHLYPNAPDRLVVTDSFWDVTTSGHATSVGGTGLSTEAMKTLQTFTDANWSIVSGSSGAAVWGQCQGQYPVLMWQFQRGVAPCPSSQNSGQNTPAPNTGTSLPVLDSGTDQGAPSAMVLPTRLQIMALPEAVLVDRSLVRGGETLVLNAGGFTEGEEFVVLIASDPQVVATVSAGSDGRLITSFMVPVDLVFGDHSVVVWPVSGMGGLRQRITVQGATEELDRSLIGTPEVLPATGGNYGVVLWLGLVLIAIGMRCMRPRWSVLRSRTPVG
jgi:alpha-tubulin suppressor-like RCC1 family protein